MQHILTIIQEIFMTPALIMGGVTLIGLLLQKKPADQVIRGTVTAVVGFVLLTAGSDFLQTGALREFGVLFNYDFHIQGVVPNMEAVSSLGIRFYAMEVSTMMFLGMIANLILARFGRFPYIFLTGHHILYMACLLAVVFHQGNMESWQIIVAGALILGLFMTCMPAMAQPFMREITKGDKIALGHFSTLGYVTAGKVAELVTRRMAREKIRSTEEICFPSKLSFMRDSTVELFLLMTGMFLILCRIAVFRTDLSLLDLSYRSGEYGHWITYAVIQGAKFAAGIYMILAGVRLVVAEIVPAFKGIAKKLVPHAKPAVDCPILFSYAPNAVMIGFFMSFLGGITTMLVIMQLNLWSRNLALPVIVPGVVAHFFCGGSAGVFANSKGGVRGCIAGSYVQGILISVLSLLVMPVLGTLNLSGTCFSDADFCAVGIVFGHLTTRFTGGQMLGFCLCCFLLPIVFRIFRKKPAVEIP